MPGFIKNWWPSGLTLAVVLYATLWPDPVGADGMMWFPGMDKLIHAVMMGGLTGAFIFDRRRSGRKLTRRFINATGLAVLIFSGLDEWAQSAMNLGRAFEAADLLADAAGIGVAMFTAPCVVNAIFRKKGS